MITAYLQLVLSSNLRNHLLIGICHHPVCKCRDGIPEVIYTSGGAVEAIGQGCHQTTGLIANNMYKALGFTLDSFLYVVFMVLLCTGTTGRRRHTHYPCLPYILTQDHGSLNEWRRRPKHFQDNVTTLKTTVASSCGVCQIGPTTSCGCGPGID